MARRMSNLSEARQHDKYERLLAAARQVSALPNPVAHPCHATSLAKHLTFLSGADAATIVLGARVPIILTSRANNLRTRMASAAVAMAHSQGSERAVGA